MATKLEQMEKLNKAVESKYNVAIAGNKTSVIMGDNAKVEITHGDGSGGAGPRQPSNGYVSRMRQALPSMSPISALGQQAQGSVHHKIKQGFALILHNKCFPKRESEPEREGSEEDVKAIRKFCEEAGFKVNQTSRKTENLTATEMDALCAEISERSFTKYDGFACFILSHGCEDGIYGTDDNIISLQEIVTKFKECDSLAGKPKLFFIQACQGTNQDGGINVDPDSHPVRPPITRLKLPSESDVLLAHSAVAGYEAYRHRQAGSWFICTLMEKLEEHAHEMHLMDILTLVNNAIAGYSTPNNLKQMSCQMTTLTKFVYFNYPAPLG